MDKLKDLKAKFKAGQISKDEYLAQVAALLAAKEIDQAAHDEAAKYEPEKEDPDGLTPEQRKIVNRLVEDQVEERLARQKTSLYKQLGIKDLKEGKALIDAARANKGADEATKAEVDALRTENKDLKVQAAVLKSPLMSGAHDPELVMLKAKARLTFDPDTGEVNNLKKTLEQVKTESPYLFKEEGGETGDDGKKKVAGKAPGGGNPPGGNPDKTKAQVDKNLELLKSVGVNVEDGSKK